jgi:hypothetical protein
MHTAEALAHVGNSVFDFSRRFESSTEKLIGALKPAYDACHGPTQKTLDSAVMTTWAESKISHGLLMKWFLVSGTGVVPWLLYSYITCSQTSVILGSVY